VQGAYIQSDVLSTYSQQITHQKRNQRIWGGGFSTSILAY